MKSAEKELLEAIEQMTEDAWQKLRIYHRGDEKIIELLDVIGKMKGWA